MAQNLTLERVKTPDQIPTGRANYCQTQNSRYFKPKDQIKPFL